MGQEKEQNERRLENANREGGNPSRRKHVQIIWNECYGRKDKNSKVLRKEKTERIMNRVAIELEQVFVYFNGVFASDLL